MYLRSVIALAIVASAEAFFWDKPKEVATVIPPQETAAKTAPESVPEAVGLELEHHDDALHSAAANNEVELLRQLLDSGRYDVNRADENGWLALHEAVKASNLDSVRILVEHGSDLNARTVVGGTALWWSVVLHSEDHPISEYLASVGAPYEGDEAGLTEPNYEEEDPVETEGSNELHYFASRGDVEQAAKVLERDPDLLNIRDNNGWQPVHEAVQGGQVDMVKFLVEHGADLNSKTFEGGTALWWARRLLADGHQVIEYLEQIGAPSETDALDL